MVGTDAWVLSYDWQFEVLVNAPRVFFLDRAKEHDTGHE